VAKKTLIIDGGDKKHFQVGIEGGTLRIADGPTNSATMRGVRVVRVHCEVEFEDDRELIQIDETGVLHPRAFRLGTTLQIGRARVSLVSAEAAPAPAATSESAPDSSVTAGPRRLKVVDGGDIGKSFLLPEGGTVTVGKPDGAADIGLHDFYVTKVHCSLEITPTGVTVTHVEGPNGTLVDGKRTTGPHPLKPGGVLRVGNSHLRLEVGPFAEESPPLAGDSGPKSDRVLRTPLPVPEPAEPAEPAGAPEVRTIGHYRLGRWVGRGFVGEVFEATHDQTGQVVALKVLGSEFPADSDELERFVREIKVAQAVRHPNLVTLLAAGKTPSRCWIAREFVPGESAEAVIARIAGGEKPSWSRAARVVVHLARALDTVHQHHLVHGNITPSNVLLRGDDHSTKLADLRLAQALEGSELQRMVLEKKLLAELGYLAPEQTDPRASIDQLTDLYAVGAVGYALITGRPPVAGKSPEEVLENIQAGRVVRPSAVYKRVPPAFDAAVMKLLAHHPEERYPSALALLRDLAPLAESHDLKV
jgi:hypothetical protein